MKTLNVILIGAGNRGQTYTNVMAKLSEQYKVVAVAEPIAVRRDYIRETHQLPAECCFEDWKPLLEKGKIADLAIISTMDRDHFAPAMKAIELGYDLLLEKPISPLPEQCVQLAKAAEEKGVRVLICTVLRYTPLFCTLKDLIDSGKIGRVLSIDHVENVGNVHQSHSFVRGNWGNEGRSSNMLLQKSCHDTDILQWLLDKKLKKVQSFGTLSYFTAKNAPAGAADRCIDGCPHADTCHYNAIKLYLEDKDNLWFRSAATKQILPTDEDVIKALKETQYGKCVFKCDNDVVDHQTINMLFEDDITVTFSMNAFNKGGREIHIFGTEGEIHAELRGDTPISLFHFDTRETEIIPASGVDGINGGHGGGDEGIIEDLYQYIALNQPDKSIPDIRTSCENHLIAFAAEESRTSGGVLVDFDNYKKQFDF